MNLDNSHKKLRILLVDDSVHDFRAFKRAFEKSDVASEITHYARAEPALQRILEDAASFDLVVTDYKLAGMNGLELCEELLRLEIPLALVILTGSGTEDLAVEALKLGVDDYLIKDPQQGYFQLLPVVLPEVVKNRDDRLVRKQAEEQVVNLAKFPSENPNPVLRIAKDGKLLYANDPSGSLLNELNCQVGEMVPEYWRQWVAEAFESGGEKRVETEHAGRTLAFAIAPVAETGYANLYGRDITESKQAEQTLRESEARFRTLFEQAAVGVAQINTRTGEFLQINQKYCDIVGYTRQEMESLTFQKITHPEDIQADLDNMNELVKGNIREFSMEKRYLHMDGSTVWVNLTVSALWKEGQVPDYHIAVVKDITERKLAEKQIVSLAKFPSENPNPVLRIAKNGQLLYANDASRVILDAWQCEPGQTVPEQWQEILSEVLATGVEKRVEEEHAERVISFSVTPITDAGYANIYGGDITDRKKAEEEREVLLHDMGERNKELACMYTVAKSIRDRKTTAGILQDVADYIPPGWHYPEITRGKVLFGSDEFVSEAFEETEWKQTSDIIVNGKCCGSVEVYYLEERPELDEGPFMAEERNLIDGIARAVSEGLERKQAEEQIENLAKFPSENPNPVLRIAKNGELLYANDASRMILSEWQCKPGQTVPEQWRQILSEVFATGAEKRVEEEHAGKAFSFSVTPVGEAGYANIYGRDITDRKSVQRQREQLMTSLEAKNRELQRFSSIVRHDFANPLLSIQGFGRELAEAVEMLGRLLQDENIQEPLRDRACTLLDDEIGSAVEFILKATDEMTKLLDGLRQIAAAGHVDINIEALDMSELIRQITGAMKFQIEESGASVQIGQLPPCCGDRAQIKQTFTNLLTNAIKYLEPGRPGQIQVYGNREEDRVVYCVEDNGIGIPPAHQDKIFDMFHRVGAKEDIAGEGLGLSIVGRIIDRHHGSISVDSQPGKGSRFNVTLPAVLELAATHANHATPNQKQG